MQTSVTQIKKIYIIAGEISGDRIGAGLINALKKLYGREVQIYGIGGAEMATQGLKSLFPMREISLMGFFEILPHIFKLKKLITQTIEDIQKVNPDVVVTIDSPGFNFRVAKLLKSSSVKTKIIHYVAPSVWAYKEGRAAKCAKLFDHLLTLFPFEVPYFTKYGLDTTCVGHPIFEYDYDRIKKPAFRLKHKIGHEDKLICITPGSRRGEIARHMPILLQVIERLAQNYEELTVGIPAPSIEIANYLKELIDAVDQKVIIVLNEEDKLNLYKSADLVLAKSGTNTLEIAACGTPQIVFYKLNIISWYIIKSMIKVKFASIINIIANKAIIPELLQNDCNVKDLTKLAMDYLRNMDNGKLQVKEAQAILETIGFRQKESANICAAHTIDDVLNKGKLV
jgi:lipid-A-disaccharide synthase